MSASEWVSKWLERAKLREDMLAAGEKDGKVLVVTAWQNVKSIDKEKFEEVPEKHAFNMMIANLIEIHEATGMALESLARAKETYGPEIIMPGG